MKQNGIKNAYGIKLNEKLEMCKTFDNFSLIEDYKDGVLYYNGNKIDLNEYLKDNIVILGENKEKRDFFDLIEFDKSI